MAMRIETSTDSLESVQKDFGVTPAPAAVAAPAPPEPIPAEPPAAPGTAPEKKEAPATPAAAAPAVKPPEGEHEPQWYRDAIKKVNRDHRAERQDLQRQIDALSRQQPKPADPAASPAGTAAEKDVKPDTPTGTYSGLREPELDDFKDSDDPYKAYAKASAKFEAAEALAKLQYDHDQTRATTAQSESVTQFITRREELKELYDDWDEAFDAHLDSGVMLTPAMDWCLMNSEVGPAIGYFLAKNPKEVTRIAKLADNKQVLEIARLEVGVGADLATRREKAKAAAAPPPPKPNGKEASPAEPSKKITSDAPPPTAKLPGGDPPKTARDLAGPTDNVGVDLKFSRDYEKTRMGDMRSSAGR